MPSKLGESLVGPKWTQFFVLPLPLNFLCSKSDPDDWRDQVWIGVYLVFYLPLTNQLSRCGNTWILLFLKYAATVTHLVNTCWAKNKGKHSVPIMLTCHYKSQTPPMAQENHHMEASILKIECSKPVVIQSGKNSSYSNYVDSCICSDRGTSRIGLISPWNMGMTKYHE